MILKRTVNKIEEKLRHRSVEISRSQKNADARILHKLARISI